MSCGVGRTPLRNQKVSEVGKANWSKNSLQLNGYRRSSQDSRISSFHLRNIDLRCAILTFPTLECDGQWRIVAIPLQYFDHTNRFGTGTQVNMNGLHLASSPSINSFKVDGRETQKGPQPEISYSAKPFRTRSLSGSDVQPQFRNWTFANKMTKLNEVSYSSSRHSSITCNDSSAVMSKGSNANMFIDCSEEDRFTKRNSRKKARRKGKHKKKHLCDVGFTESEVCTEYTCGSSASEICESSNGGVTSFQLQNISARDTDEVDISESILPSQAHKFPGERHTDNSDMHDSLVLDSVSVGSNSEEGTSARHIVNPFNDNSQEISQSELQCSSTEKGSLYCENSLCSISKTCDYTEGTKHGLGRSSFYGLKVAPGKRDKQFKSVPGKLRSIGNLHS